MLHCILLFLLALDQANQKGELALSLFLLVLLAGRLLALWVDGDLVGAEEVALRVVGETVRERAEIKKEL